MDLQKRKPAPLKGRKNYKFRLVIFILFSIFIIFSILTVSNFDAKMLPTAIATFNHTVKNKINIVINSAVDDVINKNKIESKDFYNCTLDNEGRISTLSLNTVLVNEICGKIAVEASKRLMNMETVAIEVPLGALLGIDVLSNMGPTFTVLITPVGNTTVDYKTSFQSAGINQINFQVWLNIETGIRIVNPNRELEIKVNRTVTLVNTIFSGVVPENFYSSFPFSVENE